MTKQLTIRLPEEILPFIEAQKARRGWKTDQAAVVNLLWMALRAISEPDGTDKPDGVEPSDGLTRHYQARLARVERVEAGLTQPVIHHVLVRRPLESDVTQNESAERPVTRRDIEILTEQMFAVGLRLAKLEGKTDDEVETQIEEAYGLKRSSLTHVPWPPRGLTPAEFEAVGQIEKMHRGELRPPTQAELAERAPDPGV